MLFKHYDDEIKNSIETLDIALLNFKVNKRFNLRIINSTKINEGIFIYLVERVDCLNCFLLR